MLGAVTAELNNQSALAGGVGAAGGELAARVISDRLFPGKKASELSESEKQQLSGLSQLAAGLAGGLAAGNVEGAVTAGQAGKNAVENNLLGSTSSAKRDELAEKVLNGDKSLQTAKEFLQLEYADKRSDALVAEFNKDPELMTKAEHAELLSYLKIYASEMQVQYGEAVTKELITGMLTGRDYLKSAPQTEAQKKAHTIMKTWDYHDSNAKMGDPVLLFSGNALGLTIKEGMALNAAIGTVVNTGAQLSGNEPFSYVDAIMAGITSALTTGKGIGASAAINAGEALVGSSIQDKDTVNEVLGATAGSLAGSTVSKGIGMLEPVVRESTKNVMEAVGGSLSSEYVGNQVKETIKKAKMKLIKNYRLFFLVIVSVVFCAFISMLSDLVAAIIVFFKIEKVIFSWHGFLFNAMDRSPVPGVILGVGLWLKVKFFERKNRKKSSPPDPK